MPLRIPIWVRTANFPADRAEEGGWLGKVGHRFAKFRTICLL